MTIAEILKLDVNKAVLGTFVVKTVKKSWEDTDGWMNQVVLSDNTGDMLADFHINVYQPIQRGAQIELVLAMTQHGTDGLRLYVETWEQAGEPISEPPLQGEARIVSGKIKTHLAGAFISHYGITPNKDELLAFLKSKECKEIIEEIMHGE